jgi:hypothetical protein
MADETPPKNDKNLLTMSETELHRRYAEVAEDQEPGLPMLHDELSRRAAERSATAMTRLTVAIGILTGLILVEGGLQTDVALGSPGFPTAAVAAPDFRERGAPTYYCSTQSPALAGPCTASGIFINEGGPGTEIATFSVSDQSCRTVIPSTPRGHETAASCVFGSLVRSTPQVDIAP